MGIQGSVMMQVEVDWHGPIQQTTAIKPAAGVDAISDISLSLIEPQKGELYNCKHGMITINQLSWSSKYLHFISFYGS